MMNDWEQLRIGFSLILLLAILGAISILYITPNDFENIALSIILVYLAILLNYWHYSHKYLFSEY